MTQIFRVTKDDGTVLNAHYEVDGNAVILHSRSGSSRGRHRNPDYKAGLQVLLRRATSAGFRLSGAWVDSSRVKHLPSSKREVLGHDEAETDPELAVTLITRRMGKVGQAPEVNSSGNATRRLRIEFDNRDTPDLVSVLGGVRAERDLRSLDRLPIKRLEEVTAEHVWRAVQKLRDDNVDHPFGPSTDYDLVDGDVRLPPKAVFGLAATEALGFQVLPKHFTAGLDSACFRLLKHHGYEIVAKGDETPTPPAAADLEWAEGQTKIRSHLQRERSSTVARAKKAQFIRLHGRLFCENCGLDPAEEYGEEVGDACIEVHHDLTAVSDMEDGHVTRLDDLQCLCANCHRIVHRRIKLGTSRQNASLR